MPRGTLFESAVHQLVEQARRRNGTEKELPTVWAMSYGALLDELFFYYHESTRKAARGSTTISCGIQ
jgi:hypothetical protein